MIGRLTVAFGIALTFLLGWILFLWNNTPSTESEQQFPAEMQSEQAGSPADSVPRSLEKDRELVSLLPASDLSRIAAIDDFRRLLKVQDPAGSPVDFTAVVVVEDEMLRQSMQAPDFFGEDFSNSSIPLLHHSTGSAWITLPGLEKAIAVIIEAHGFYTQVFRFDEVALAMETLTAAVTPATPMRIVVVDQGEQPVSEAVITVRSADLAVGRDAPIHEYLCARAFEKIATTSHDGAIVLQSPYAQKMMIHVDAPEGLADVTQWDIEAQPHLTLHCLASFTIAGTIRLDSGEGLPEAYLSVLMLTRDSGELPIATSTTDKEGGFLFTDLPADSSLHYVLLHQDGYQPASSKAFTARAGAVQAIHLTTSTGVTGSLRFVTEWGHPIANSECMLYLENHERFPYSFNTDSSGIVQLPQMMSSEHLYYASLSLSGYWRSTEIFKLDDSGISGSPLELTIKDLSEIMKVVVNSDGNALTQAVANWFPADTSSGNCSVFPVANLPVLAPSGPGDLVLKSEGAMAQQYRVHLLPGPGQEITIASHTSILEFQIPAGVAERLEVLSVRNALLHARDLPSGAITLQLLPGNYYVSVTLDGGEVVDVGPFQHGERGTDLGLLDLDASASISGTVRMEDGEPVNGVTVRAVSPSGYRSAPFTTGNDGTYTLSGLPSGEYQVRCVIPRSTDGACGDLIRTQFVGARSQTDGLDFTLPDNGTTLVTLIGGSDRPKGAYYLSDSDSFLVSTHGSRRARMPLSKSEFSAGFWGGDRDECWLVATDFPAGAGKTEILFGGTQVYAFSQEDTRGWPVSLRLRSSGIILPFILSGSGENDLRIETNVADSLDVGLRSPAGEWRWRRLDESSWNEKSVEVSVADLEGNSISGAHVVCRESRNVGLTDARGRVEILAEESEWVWIDHSAFWALQTTLDEGATSVTLRRSASARTLNVRAAGEVRDVSLLPLFDLGYSLEVSIARDPKNRALWHLQPVPEGKYRIVVIEEDGSRLERETQFRHDGPETVEYNQ